MKKYSRRNIFISNALILSVVNIIMRGIAVSFNAFINEKIGSESMGLFTLVMSVYGFALTVALSCVNLGAVKITSERCAKLDGGDKTSWRWSMNQVVKSVSLYSLLFGLCAGAVLFVSADAVGIHLLRDARTVRSLRILAISLPAISLSSGLSGYFTGIRKVKVNALCAFNEQFFKIIVISTALVMLTSSDVEEACVAVVGGSALSEAWSLLINFVLYIIDSKKPNDTEFGKTEIRLKTSFSDIARVSFPSAVGTYARQGLTTMEHLAIPRGLVKSGLTQKAALSTYGILQGIALPLVMFPYSVIGAFTALLVPDIAEKHELGDEGGIKLLTERVYEYSAIFSLCAAGIFINFAEWLGLAVYSSSEAAKFTLILGILVPFMYLDTAVDSILKGLGEQIYVMKVNIADSAAGLILVLLLTPRMGIYGYILCVCLCEIGNLIYSVRRLGERTGCGLKVVVKYHMRPIVCLLISTILNSIFSGMIGPAVRIFLFSAIYLLLCLKVKVKGQPFSSKKAYG